MDGIITVRQPMSHIQKRQVFRWFVNGKGYATPTAAYKVLAKREMWEMVSKGKQGLLYDCYEDPTKHRDLVDSWYASHFPHTGSPECRKVCRHVEPNGKFHFKSCKSAQKQWIDRRVKEMREADGREGS